MMPESKKPVLVTRYLGNCQICEGDFKTTEEGKVALHGYKRPGDGHVHGHCPGEGHLAYEKSANLIPLFVKGLRRDEERAEETLGQIDRGEIESFTKPAWLAGLPHRSFKDVKKSEVPGDVWRRELSAYRGRVDSDRRHARLQREHFEQRLKNWTLRPLREIDELGRTAEQRAAQEERKGTLLAARKVRKDKARELLQKRGDKLIRRKEALDGAGKLFREAAAKGDRDGALAVVKELTKKKNRTLFDLDYTTKDALPKLKRMGVFPEDFPAPSYDWQLDLNANDALVELGLAKKSAVSRSGVEFDHWIWR
jgi:hypothetical protein